MNGKAQIVYSNGDKYDGDFKDGEKSGKGVYKYSTGDIYEGEWLKD